MESVNSDTVGDPPKGHGGTGSQPWRRCRPC